MNGEGRRVLVVDDEQAVRLMTIQALQRHGFVPEGAEDGIEALELFAKNSQRFSIVITDLMMPRMNGRKLAREIRRLSPDMPILAASGLLEAAEGVDSDLAQIGIRTVLRKPYTEGELLAALQAELSPAATP